jgi:hypothetical protein
MLQDKPYNKPLKLVNEVVQASTSYYSRRAELLEIEHQEKMKNIEEEREQQKEMHRLKIEFLQRKEERDMQRHQLKVEMLNKKLTRTSHAPVTQQTTHPISNAPYFTNPILNHWNQ